MCGQPASLRRYTNTPSSSSPLSLDALVPIPKAPCIISSSTQHRRRRTRPTPIPAYLRADFPTSKWVFTPTETDLLKPAAAVVMELDAGGISRMARRTPIRPRRRSAPATYIRPGSVMAPGSAVVAPHSPVDAHSAVSTFVDSVTERAVLACVEAAGRLAHTSTPPPVVLKHMPPTVQYHDELEQYDEVRAPTFAWDQKLKCAGRLQRARLRSARLCRQSPVIRWRLCALQQLDTTRTGGTTRLETQLAHKIAQAELSAAEKMLTQHIGDEDHSDASTHSVALVPVASQPCRRRRLLSLPCVTRSMLTNSAARQQAAERKEAHRREVAARRHYLLLQEQRRLAQPLEVTSIERKRATRWLTVMRLALTFHAVYLRTRQPVTSQPSGDIRSAAAHVDFFVTTPITPELERAVVMLQCAYRMRRQDKLIPPGMTKRIVQEQMARARAEKVQRERDEAVAIIKVCLNPLTRAGIEIRVAVRTFLDCVRRCQRTVRPYLALRELRISVLHRIWLHLERVIFHPASSQLFAASRRLGGVCPPNVGPKLARFADVVKHERIDRLHGQDAFWRVPNDARFKAIRRIFSDLLHQHIADRTEFQRQHRHRRPSKRLDMRDVRLFITDQITADTLQLKAKDDAPRNVSAPDFVLYSRAPPLILDALKRLYQKRREKRRMLDPAYDKELLRQIDALLGGTGISTTITSSKGTESQNMPAAQPNSIVPVTPPPAAETLNPVPPTHSKRRPAVLSKEGGSVLEIECTS